MRISAVNWMFTLAIASLFIGACATKPKGPSHELVLKPKLNEKEISQYHSRTLTRFYKDSMLNKKREEQLDFKIESTAVKVNADLDPNKSEIIYEVKSFDKSGDGDLNDFAFPEPGEVLQYTFNRHAEVLNVEKRDKDSVFYIPPIALPKAPVQVGDTWQMKKQWKTDKQSIPLEMDVVTIFKELADCNGQACAVLEVSGKVQILDLSDDAKLDSEIAGWALFNIQSGEVLWSYVKSHQNLLTAAYVTELDNCLISYVNDTGWTKFEEEITPYCRIDDLVTKENIPGL